MVQRAGKTKSGMGKARMPWTPLNTPGQLGDPAYLFLALFLVSPLPDFFLAGCSLFFPAASRGSKLFWAAGLKPGSPGPGVLFMASADSSLGVRFFSSRQTNLLPPGPLSDRSRFFKDVLGPGSRPPPGCGNSRALRSPGIAPPSSLIRPLAMSRAVDDNVSHVPSFEYFTHTPP